MTDSVPLSDEPFENQEILENLLLSEELVMNYFTEDMTPYMREQLVTWMFELGSHLKLYDKTKHLSIEIMDKMLIKQIVPKEKLQLLGIMSLCLAAKNEENIIISYKELYNLSGQQYSYTDLLQMELSIFKKLHFQLIYPVAIEFMGVFTSMLLEGPLDEQVHENLNNLLEYCLSESSCLMYKKSEIAIGCLIQYFMSVGFQEGINALLSLIQKYENFISYTKVLACYELLKQSLKGNHEGDIDSAVIPHVASGENLIIIEESTANSYCSAENSDGFDIKPKEF